MVTHENDIAAWAKRVVRMRDGKIESDERNHHPHPTHDARVAAVAPGLAEAFTPPRRDSAT
jgi:hypothetical protein